MAVGVAKIETAAAPFPAGLALDRELLTHHLALQTARQGLMWMIDCPAVVQARVPDLADGKSVLVTAHGNSLRALVKHLDGIGDDDIAELNIPTGIPLVYRLSEDFTPLGPGEYLDPEAAAAGAAAVAAQGAKK